MGRRTRSGEPGRSGATGYQAPRPSPHAGARTDGEHRANGERIARPWPAQTETTERDVRSRDPTAAEQLAGVTPGHAPRQHRCPGRAPVRRHEVDPAVPGAREPRGRRQRGRQWRDPSSSSPSPRPVVSRDSRHGRRASVGATARARCDAAHGRTGRPPPRVGSGDPLMIPAQPLASAQVAPHATLTSSGIELGGVAHEVDHQRTDLSRSASAPRSAPRRAPAGRGGWRRPARSAPSMRTSATLKMSAARPWMPAFIAWRSPAWRMRKLELSSSGIGRRRPNSVSV